MWKRKKMSRGERVTATLALILKADRPLRTLEIARLQGLQRTPYLEAILDELCQDGLIERTLVPRGTAMLVYAYQAPYNLGWRMLDWE